MALKKRISDEEVSVLEVLEDPIWFGEFLRSTADAAMNKEEWPTSPFKYRWYQKDILSDKNEYIVVRGGRAIGKCSPGISRIYTHPFGYVDIKDYLKSPDVLKNTVIYSLDEDDRIVHRPATITPNEIEHVYTVKTRSGYSFIGNKEHPIRTPKGYVEIQDLGIGNQVAIVTKLPHQSSNNVFSWEELRWMGYSFGYSSFRFNRTLTLRNKKQFMEMRRIADYFNVIHRIEGNDFYFGTNRNRGTISYQKRLLKLLDWNFATRAYITKWGIPSIPIILKAERLENLKIFLESFLSLHGNISKNGVNFTVYHEKVSQDFQELFLRFSIALHVQTVRKESKTVGGKFVIRVVDEDLTRFFQTFSIPGVQVNRQKTALEDKPLFIYEEIESIVRSKEEIQTYAVYVPITNNYISDNFLVHNSLVLEDILLYDVVNSDISFFDSTKEQLLATPNSAQLQPLLNKFLTRLSNSMLTKGFIQHISKGHGTVDCRSGSSTYRLYARIAGKTGESNFIGLHLPRIIIDEAQIFPMTGFTQMQPSYNHWEKSTRQIYCGVPTGGREGNVLYYLDQNSIQFKKYRIPATENPFFTARANIEYLKKYGGEDSQDYVNLILGDHGFSVHNIIPSHTIVTEPYDFYNYRYDQEKDKKEDYRDALDRRDLYRKKRIVQTFLALDTGFIDPTVGHIIAKYDDNTWRVLVRYTLTRVPFPKQAEIIEWLDAFYDFDLICIDYGAGGSGLTLSQILQTDRFGKKFRDRIHGVYFNQAVEVEEIDGVKKKYNAKSLGGSELSRMIQDKELKFSEMDFEGISQLERVSYQTSVDGLMKFFVISEDGKGKSKSDHIFASYLVFTITLLTKKTDVKKKKLFRAFWS